jgi:hypothetical protein
MTAPAMTMTMIPGIFLALKNPRDHEAGGTASAGQGGGFHATAR